MAGKVESSKDEDMKLKFDACAATHEQIQQCARSISKFRLSAVGACTSLFMRTRRAPARACLLCVHLRWRWTPS